MFFAGINTAREKKEKEKEALASSGSRLAQAEDVQADEGAFFFCFTSVWWSNVKFLKAQQMLFFQFQSLFFFLWVGGVGGGHCNKGATQKNRGRGRENLS